MSAVPRLILCEGQTDKTFLGRWLESRGFRACLGWPPAAPWDLIGHAGVAQTDRDHRFVSAADVPVIVRDCGGDSKVLKRLQQDAHLDLGEGSPTVLVVLDGDAQRAPDDSGRALAQAVGTALGSAWTQDRSAGVPTWRRREGGRPVVLGVMSVSAAHRVPGVIARNLDGLLVTALCKAYPDRAREVAAWLAPKSDLGSKNQLWSWMAGWWANQGCVEFPRTPWGDAAVRPHLEAILHEAGVEAALDAALGPPA